MKQSKTTIKELTARYRAVLLKCALINAMMIIGIGAANAADLVIDGTAENPSKIITSADPSGREDFGALKMSGGELRIERTGEESSYSELYFTDDSTISGGTITLSTPSNGHEDSDADLSFGGNLTITGADTVIDISGEGELNNHGTFALTDAVLNIHDSANEAIDGGGSFTFTNAKITISNSSFSPWSAGSYSWILISKDEYMTLSDTEKAAYTLNLQDASGSTYKKLLKNPLTEEYFSAEEAERYSLYDQTYSVPADITMNDGTLIVDHADFSSDRNIIIDGTTVTMKNGSYMAVIGEEEKYNGLPFQKDLTLKGSSSVNVSGNSYIFAGNMFSKYDDAEDYLLDTGKMTEAEIMAAFKPNESNADINIQDSAEITLNDTSAIALLDKNSGKINLTGGKVNMNDSAAIYGALIVDGGELNVNGNNSIKNNLNLEPNWLNSVDVNGTALLLFSAAEGTAPAIALKTGTINLSGRLHANITATGGNVVFNNSAARLNGELSGSGVNLTFNDNYLFSNINNKASLNTVTIAAGKTLDIGSGTLTATNFTGGTISAVLTDAAKNAAIITGNATDVTLALDMTNASRDEVTQYHITNGTGFTFGDYATNRYAVSGTSFDLADASSIGALSGWNGGDLYILRLATAGEAAVEDLEKAGVLVSLAEQNAIKALDLAQSVLSKLDAAKQEAIAKVNDLLDQAAGKAQETKQILREIAPDTSSSGTKTALNTAKSVINVIGTRLGGGTSGNMRGRSGGDYSVGQSSVWAQGMYNYAKLDTSNGFKSDSTGFAAGIETNLTDSFKTGIGYAFTKTDIDSDRSQTDVDTHTGFIYAEYKPNKFYVNAIASYGHSEYDDTTNLIGLTSDYDADTIGARIATGYNFGILTPEAALRYTHVKQDDHTDALGATMRSKSFDTWTAVGGVKLSKKYTLKSNHRIGITPELKLAATYDFERDDETNTVVLADGSSYIVEGDMLKRFGIEAGANVGVTIGNDSEITLSYEGKFKKDYQDHTGLINFKYNF